LKLSLDKIIFVHQGKTGGASLVKSFRNIFGDENVYRDIDKKTIREKHKWVAYLQERLEKHRRYKELSRYRVIHGHFNPEKYRKAFPDALHLTFYRNPVQQLVSLYYFWQRTPGYGAIHPNRQILLDNKLSLIEFAELTNPKRTKKSNSLYSVQKFDFVGITEAYESSIELLNKLFLHDCGLNIKEETHNTNPGKGVGKKYELDASIYRILCELLQPKLDLYSKAVDVFRDNCKKADVELIGG
jgi:hypothetical protein